MSQVKIYALRSFMQPVQTAFSEALHTCVCHAFQLPVNKRFHRFFLLDKEDFIFPDDRSDHYIIIEISMFEGRSMEAKKTLYQYVYAVMKAQFQVDPNDIEITIFETPKHNWSIRGKSGDELYLDYKINV